MIKFLKALFSKTEAPKEEPKQPPAPNPVHDAMFQMMHGFQKK